MQAYLVQNQLSHEIESHTGCFSQPQKQSFHDFPKKQQHSTFKMNGMFGNLWKIVFIGTGIILVILGLVLCGYGASKVVDYNQLIDEAFDSGDENNENDDYIPGGDDDTEEDIQESLDVDIPAAIIAAAGLLTFLFVLIGCCGVWKESRIVLGVYIPLMLVVFIVLGVCVIVVFVSESQEARDRIAEEIDLYDPDCDSGKSKAATKAVDNIQKTLKCCGVDGYEDWLENDYISRAGLRVPESCCQTDALKDDIETCTTDPDSKAELFESCSDALNPFGREVAIIALVTFGVMILNLISSCVVCAMAG